MRTILLAWLVCFLNSAFATNYYFSTSIGNDSRSFVQAQNASTPWKTLKKLNSIFSSLQPGDKVLLKRGETFYGSIIVSKSGSSTSPIVIGAYGTGNRPVITSLVKLNNWVSKNNGIWESYNSSLGSSVNIVLLNGVQQGMGRYPNGNAANGGYLTFESHAGKYSITDKQLTSAINWTGAELVLRTRRWLLDRKLIKSHSGSTIYYATGSDEPKNGYGYFIQNSIKTLNKLGEWYYNPSTRKLSVYFGSNGPSSHTVQASTISDLIHSEWHSNVVFKNLTIKGANVSGVNITNGSNMAVEDCDILLSGENGMAVNGHSKFRVENCTVSNSNNNGIDFEWGMTSATVKNNKILNTSLIAGTGLSGDGNGVGIYDNGDGNIVEYNEIRNTCHNGMRFRGNNLIIKNNLIDRFCLVKDDGAGIYSYGGHGTTGIKVIGNIIKNGIGAEAGTGTSTYSASGIYIDHNDAKIEVRDNTVTDCHDYGLYVHNSSGITIRNNTLYNNRRRQLTMIQGQPVVSTLIRNNVITKNIFFAKTQAQLASYIESSEDDITSFGRFDSNYYARPIDDRITIYNHYPGVVSNLDLEGWKKQYGDDPASKRTAKQIAAYKINRLIGSNKVANGLFATSKTGVISNSCTVSWSNAGLLDGGYLKITPSSKTSSVSFKIGGITAGKKYIVKYSVRASTNNNMVVTSYLRKDASPYTIITEKQGRKVSTARSENEIMFVAVASTSTGAVQFKVDQQSTYYLDNIRVHEVDAKITNPDDSIRFVFNATKANKTLSLDGGYFDTKGSKFSNSITLSPYASAILIKDNSTANIAPKVNITSPSNNATFTGPTTIKLAATASDADGTISKVQFYKGSTLLHTEDESPYEWRWGSVPVGNYTITAKATDNDGKTTTSASILISVTASKTANTPTVSMTSPLDNAIYTAPASISMSAKASDADGTISKVEFYKNSTLIHTETDAPYTWNWNNVPAGNYELTVKAIDNSGLKTTSSSVSISVTNTSIQTTDTAANNSNIAIGNQNTSNDSLSLQLGPNPAVSDLNIYIGGTQKGKTLLSLYSLSGVLLRTIQPGTASQVIHMDISSLSRGVYIVTVTCGKSVLSKRFVKLR
jgi:parallel beta-helix repeat protein